MGIPTSVSKVLAAASANNICLSQTPLAGGNLTINGAAATAGVATLDTQRRVLFTFAADETGRSFVVYGTNQSGSSISETVAGTATTAVTLFDYLTITRISVDDATANALTVGTNGVGSTLWQAADPWVAPFNIGFGVDVAGTVNFSVEITQAKDPFGILSPTLTPPFASAPTALASKSADTAASVTDPCSAWRLTINSGTAAATAYAVQSGISG